jgi:alkylated DNA repair protein (DNA oxidative demethylase)
MRELFDIIAPTDPPQEVMAKGAMLLRGAALPFTADILTALRAISDQAPFRRMVTPGGFVMSVAMTNCGAAGWVTDRTDIVMIASTRRAVNRGRRMASCILGLAVAAATNAGYPDFVPDACLINRYEPGARLSLY